MAKKLQKTGKKHVVAAPVAATVDAAAVERVPSASPGRTLRNTHELLELLEAVSGVCRPPAGSLTLLEVNLPEPHLVGQDIFYVFAARASNPATLHGFDPGEFHSMFPGVTPVLPPGAPPWTFDANASGALLKRLVPVTRPGLLGAVAAAVEEALEQLDHADRKYREWARLPSAQPWQHCAICSPLVNGERGPDVDSSHLEILGAPFFHDRTGERHWCIKRCPLCGTHYRWAHDYEYIVNGGGDEETSLVRLDDPQARAKAAEVEDLVHAYQASFAVEARRHLEGMATHEAGRLKDATSFFSYEATVHGHDLGFAVPALVAALAGHVHAGQGSACQGASLESILGSFAEQRFAWAVQVKQALERTVPTTTGPELAALRLRVERAVRLGPRVGERVSALPLPPP